MLYQEIITGQLVEKETKIIITTTTKQQQIKQHNIIYCEWKHNNIIWSTLILTLYIPCSKRVKENKNTLNKPKKANSKENVSNKIHVYLDF
jgi:hypothetical protein